MFLILCLGENLQNSIAIMAKTHLIGLQYHDTITEEIRSCEVCQWTIMSFIKAYRSIYQEAGAKTDFASSCCGGLGNSLILWTQLMILLWF